MRYRATVFTSAIFYSFDVHIGKTKLQAFNHWEVCYYQFIDLLKKGKGKKRLEHLPYCLLCMALIEQVDTSLFVFFISSIVFLYFFLCEYKLVFFY